MKFIIKAVFAISLLSVKLYAQYFAVQIKENFDYLSAYNKLYSWDYLYVEKNLNPPFNNFLIPIDSTLNDRLGEKYGHILRGLIRMYETIQDKC